MDLYWPSYNGYLHNEQYRPTCNLHIIAEPAAIWDSSQSSSGKLGGREFQDVCTSKQEVVDSNPARVACEGFFTDTRKALSIQCYTHVGGGQN